MKRSRTEIDRDRQKIKALILKEFPDVEFQAKDVYYKLRKVFNRSTMQMIYTDIVQLSKDGFLSYSLKKDTNGRDRKRNRAFYKIAKKKGEEA